MSESKPSYLTDVNEKPQDRATAALDAVLTKSRAPIGARRFNPLLRHERKDIVAQEAAAMVEAAETESLVAAARELAVSMETPQAQTQTLKEAASSDPILPVYTEREQARILIVTKDTTLTSAQSLTKTRVLRLSERFAEVHCIVLSVEGEGFEAPSRLSHNVWVYPTCSKRPWRVIFDALRVAKEQLHFAGGFRVDMVLAEDPFESGLAAYMIARKYDRPYEIHVFDDFYDPGFRYMEDYNDLRLIAARFVLPRANGIRTESLYLKDRLTSDYRKMKDRIETLPVYYDLVAWRDAEPRFNLKERYPQFRLALLHISSMTDTSHTDRVITGTARVLAQHPQVGLVIAGDGPQYEKLKKQVAILGLSTQVIFEGVVRDFSSHMRSSDVLLHFSEDPEDSYLLLQAAAIGLPIVASMSGLASELFIDGESALLCSLDHPSEISDKVAHFLNRPDLRVRCATTAQAVVFDSVEQNYTLYLDAYRDSIIRGALPYLT